MQKKEGSVDYKRTKYGKQSLGVIKAEKKDNRRKDRRYIERLRE